ncbi:hypothetical protein BOTBODRAFT_390453 [Botryobasidium botryosum FD-172 SS1]|uniref:Uncharacterized protein n=1 Tax=Botryobasidium botryosum (strain FD-172 SS1) TaxID=930990 RepID=A0A067N8V4_BOTB1|nr:hypothetical protein BOTBODRAFT_390453 [Botryobasidium botryosum FD-172 SS1]
MGLPPKIEPVAAEDFAAILGFTDDDVDLPSEEERRDIIVNDWHARVDSLGVFPKDVLYSKFCAVYLPQLMEGYLSPPLPEDLSLTREYEGFSSYTAVLGGIQDNPYFFKFMTSREKIAAPGKRLAYVQANRILVQAEEWDRGLDDSRKIYARSFQSAIGNSVQLLSTALTMLDGDPAFVPVDKAVATRILPYIEKWKKRFGTGFGGDACKTASGLLKGEKYYINFTRLQRAMLEGLGECALPSCKNDKDLRACGRCAQIYIATSKSPYTYLS